MSPNQVEQQEFSNTIFQMVEELQLTHFESLLYYAEKHDIEIEVISQLVSPSLKALIEKDVSELHLLKKQTARLPI